MPIEYPQTWKDLMMTFQLQRRENATIGHDHEHLDEIEKMLFEHALEEEFATPY